MIVKKYIKNVLIVVKKLAAVENFSHLFKCYKSATLFQIKEQDSSVEIAFLFGNIKYLTYVIINVIRLFLEKYGSLCIRKNPHSDICRRTYG